MTLPEVLFAYYLALITHAGWSDDRDVPRRDRGNVPLPLALARIRRRGARDSVTVGACRRG